jgi:hypothetical protein
MHSIVELKVGDRIPSANDVSYGGYCDWCKRLGYPVGQYSEWMRMERVASGFSVIGGSTLVKAPPTREQQARARLGRIRTQREKEFSQPSPPPLT